jgi:Holliday junction DNA helicase RuvB
MVFMADELDLHNRSFGERDNEFDRQLRPLSFDDFKGQDKIVSNLKVFVQAAKMRDEALDHVLLSVLRDGEKLLCQDYFDMNLESV